MICPRCGRLNEDGSNFCRFCSYDFSSDSSEQSLVPPEGNPYTAEKPSVDGPKYKKFGVAVLFSAVAAAVAVVILIVTLLPNGAEKAAKTYANAYMNGDFAKLTAVSAADTQKYYQSVTQSGIGNLWGIFAPYSSYGEMMGEYAQAYAKVHSELEASYGQNFKTSLSNIKSQKLSDAELYNLLNLYNQTYGDILKDGEKTEVKLVSMTVTVDGTGSQNNVSYVNFYVIKIDSSWYVVTDGSLASYSL